MYHKLIYIGKYMEYVVVHFRYKYGYVTPTNNSTQPRNERIYLGEGIILLSLPKNKLCLRPTKQIHLRIIYIQKSDFDGNFSYGPSFGLKWLIPIVSSQVQNLMTIIV